MTIEKTGLWGSVGIVFLVFALAAGFFVGGAATRRFAQAEQQDASTREARILSFIVERNPQATIKDFNSFPQVLLAESQSAGIDFRIIMAIIDKESQFNPRAIGKSGEVGLMQVMPSTAATIAKDLGLKWLPPSHNDLGTLGDPRLNIRIGISYLRDQMDKFGATPTALRAYNRGDVSAREYRPGDRYAEDVGLRLVSLVQTIQ